MVFSVTFTVLAVLVLSMLVFLVMTMITIIFEVILLQGY